MRSFYLKLVCLTLLSLTVISNAHASGSKRPALSAEEETAAISYPVVTPAENPTTNELEVIEDKYSHLDPDKVVPAALLTKTLNFYEANKSIIKNKRYIVIIDFKQHNTKKRFYLIDMESGEVEQYLTAHGKNSDSDFDGFATKFSNTPDSLMTSLGFYLTAETYYGEHDYSLRLDGLSNTNSNARKRAIVIHGAWYVNSSATPIGRSYGCPALDENYSTQVIDMIKGGTLIYADG